MDRVQLVWAVHLGLWRVQCTAWGSVHPAGGPSGALILLCIVGPIVGGARLPEYPVTCWPPQPGPCRLLLPSLPLWPFPIMAQMNISEEDWPPRHLTA